MTATTATSSAPYSTGPTSTTYTTGPATTSSTMNPTTGSNYPGSTGTAGNSGYYDPQKRFTRSRILWLISLYLSLCWLGWFIVEIIVHCLPQQFASYAILEPLSSMSMQLFMYAMLLTAASLSTAWLADFKRTQAARTAAFFVSTFSIFAWMWELWFVIPAFRAKDDVSNVFCNGVNPTGTAPIVGTPADRFCGIARATAAFSVAVEFGLVLIYSWCLARFVVTRESDIPYPTPGLSTSSYAANPVVTNVGQTTTSTATNYRGGMTSSTTTTTAPVTGTATPIYPLDVKFLYLTEPDDIEQLRIVAAKPMVYDIYRKKMRGLSAISLGLAAFSLCGFIIISCSYIKIARDVGINAYTTFNTNQNQFGDPVLSSSWWPLILLLGLSLGMTSYAAFRWHRGIQGAAFLITVISAITWSSFFIYSARRLNLSEDSAAFSTSSARDAQRAVVAGIGLILLCEVLRSIVLYIRYQTYMPITAVDHQSLRTPGYVDAPTVVVADKDRDDYKTGHEHSENPNAPVEQAVNVPGPAAHMNYPVGDPNYTAADPNYPVGTNYPAGDNLHGRGDWKPAYNLSALSGSTLIFRILFVLTILTLLAWWVMEWVGQCSSGIFTVSAGGPSARPPETTYIVAEKMFILTSLLALGTLSMTAYADYHASVAAAISAFYVNSLMLCGFFLLVWPWAYNALPHVGVLDTQACDASGNRWCNIGRAAAIFAIITAGWMAFIWLHSLVRIFARRRLVRKFDRTIHTFPSLVALLPIIGFILWAAANIDLATSNGTFLSNYGNLQPYAIGADVPTSYWASIIFLLLTAATFAILIGTFATYQMLCWEGWGWRHLATHINLLVASFMIPILILTCRFINNESFSRPENVLASGIIILTSGQIFFFAAVLFLAHTSIYASRAPAQSLRPGYQANVGQYEKNAVYETPAKDLEKGYGGGYTDPKEAAYNPDIQHERDTEMGTTSPNPPVVTTTSAPIAPPMTTEYHA